MAEDLNIFPYYSNYLGDYAKGYKIILSKPNKAVQARELIDSQLLIHEQIKENFDTVYKQGSIVSGCDITIQYDDVESKWKCYCSGGQFYFDGRILKVSEQNIEITGSGTENIGFWVEETFVSYSEDSSLTDPASGTTNYGIDGADRLKVDVVLVKIFSVVPDPRPELEDYQKYADTNNLTSIWELEDRVVQNYIRRPDYSLITKVLAKRTFDESGHYLVSGMKLEAEDSDEDGNIKIVINPGTCYVRGYDNTFVVAKSIDVPKALTTQSYSNEPHAFISGTSQYQLNYPYVVTDETVQLINVTALIEKTITVTRGSGSYDNFEDAYGETYTSISSIESIPGYVQSVDYELDADKIHWIGAAPGVGVDYLVTFRYFKNSIRDTEYEIVENSSTPNTYDVKWTGTGDQPVNSSDFLVDYYTYMARTDLFSIDKFGNIIRSIGIDVNYDQTLIPPFSDEMLPMGWIKFFPGRGASEALIFEYNFKRTTMFEMHYLKDRVNDLEENVASLALETEVKEGEDSSTLNGIFVDPFNNLYKANVEHADYYASTNLIDGILQLVSEQKEVTLDRSNDVLTLIETWVDSNAEDQYYTLDKISEQSFFLNTLKSEVANLNPFGYIKKSPIALMRPDHDNYISTRVVEKTIVDNVVKETSTGVNSLQWSTLKSNTVETVEAKITKIGSGRVGTEKNEITTRLITFARERRVNVKGTNFEPGSKLTAVFGGKYVKLIATSPYRNYTEGGSEGKLLIASDGSFKGYFIIPSGVKNGDIELRLQDESNNVLSLVYRSKGVKKIIEKRTTVTSSDPQIFPIESPSKEIHVVDPPEPPETITDSIPEKSWVKDRNRKDLTLDPLAQSFIFAEDKILVAFDLFFATKADSKSKPVIEDELYDYETFEEELPVILQIGYMKNGFPDTTKLLLMQEISPTDITTSLYGETATHISLLKPVFIPAMQDFFISVGSKSTEYTVYVSSLGGTDLESGNVILKNPYQDGNLFTSSNGITWTAEQQKDMSIVLYEGVFSSSGTVQLEEITFPYDGWSGFNRFIFTNDYIEVPDTTVRWYYSINSGTTWKAFDPSEEIEESVNITKILIKCELQGSTEVTTLTPIVDIESSLIVFRYDSTVVNQYRTKPVEELNEYNNVKIILDEYIKSSTTLIKEFIFTDIYGDSQTMRIVTDPVSSVDLGDGFFRKTYTFNILLLQRVTLDSVANYTVGEDVGIVGTWPTVVGQIVSIDSVNKYAYVLREGDSSDEFEISDVMTNGTTTHTVTLVYNYTSEPTWPTDWIGKILLQSTQNFKSPQVKNYRAIMRAL